MSSKPRIEIIDALRGFALAGIVIVHIVEQYIGGPAPESLSESARIGTADYIVDGFIQVFLRGKFFALFSILFGLSFFIQFENARKKQENYQLRYLWRIFLLFVIGFAHHCFYKGDILTIYAMLAPILILFIPLSNKALWIVIGIIFIGLPRMILFLIYGDQSIFGGPLFDPASPEIQNTFDTLKEGSLKDVFRENVHPGFRIKMAFQLGIFYRFYLTLAFFLIGMWLGRIGYFHRLEEYKAVNKRVLKWSFAGVLVGAALTAGAFTLMGGEFSFANPWAVIGFHMGDLVNIFLTAIILTSFVLIYQTSRGQNWLNVFKEYGRTALTNYVTQSIMGTFILFGWGLGYLGEWRNITLFGLAILIIFIQILISKWWMKRFRYGPLEWLWRSVTYFKKV